MKICQPHWEKMKAEIEKLGLSQFISKNSKEAFNRMTSDAVDLDVMPADPLMMANNMIWSRSIEHLGLYLMAVKEDGSHFCPLCEVNEKLPPLPETNTPCGEYWLETLMPHIKTAFVEAGWIKK